MIDEPHNAILKKLIAMNLPFFTQAEIVQPADAVRDEIFDRVFPPRKVESFLKNLPSANSQAVVVADIHGVTEWVSPSFSRMCGYDLHELRGNTAGKMLQGAETTAASVKTLRDAIRERRSVKVQMVNYHKQGSRYDVEIELSPTFAPDGEFTGFIAIEHEVL